MLGEYSMLALETFWKVFREADHVRCTTVQLVLSLLRKKFLPQERWFTLQSCDMLFDGFNNKNGTSPRKYITCRRSCEGPNIAQYEATQWLTGFPASHSTSRTPSPFRRNNSWTPFHGQFGSSKLISCSVNQAYWRLDSSFAKGTDYGPQIQCSILERALL